MTRKILIIIIAMILSATTLLSACKEKITDPQSELLSEQSVLLSESKSDNLSKSISTFDSSAKSSADSVDISLISTVQSSVSQISSADKSKEQSSAENSSSASKVSSAVVSVETSSTASSPVSDKKYYIAGSWNGYIVDDEFFQMEPVAGAQNWYTVQVDLTESNRNPLNDGHWYKVTEGNWNNSYGTDDYVQQPAPIKKDANNNPIGLGSIWIDENLTLTVMFDTTNKIVYDNADGKTLPMP